MKVEMAGAARASGLMSDTRKAMRPMASEAMASCQPPPKKMTIAKLDTMYDRKVKARP